MIYLVINDKKNNFCVQRPSSLGGASGEGDFVGTEDCLYLDIRKPKTQIKTYQLCFGYMVVVILLA